MQTISPVLPLFQGERVRDARVRSKGFTLIEILVALVLFAVGAVVFAQMQVLSVKGSSFGKDALTAITLAQQNLEQLKSTPFDAIAGGTETSGAMNVTWTVAVSGTAPSRSKTILLTVSWAGKRISFTTVVSEV